MTFNFGGFAGGLTQGLEAGQRINDLIQQDQIAKVRAQGIAEARAMQAAGTPQIQDNGDMDNLTANPQASADPNAAPVNTSLATSPAMQGVAPQDTGGMTTVPVAAPDALNTGELSSVPVAGADPNAAPAAGITIKGGKRFMVGDQGFDDLAAAQAHAKNQAPNLNDLLQKTLVPKMQEAYLAQGNPEMADAWTKWSQNKDNQAKAKSWMQAFSASQIGDYDNAVKHIQDANPDAFAGKTVVSTEPVTNKDGSVDSFNLTYKDDATGKVATVPIDKNMIQLGLAASSPQAAFEKKYEDYRTDESNDAKLAMAKEVAKRQAQGQIAVANRQVTVQALKGKQQADLEATKQAGRLELAKTNAQLDAANASQAVKDEVNGKMDALRSNGYGEDEVRQMLPSLLKADQFRKVTDPVERRATIAKSLIDSGAKPNDPTFTGKVDAAMSSIYGQGGGANAPSRSARTAPVNPVTAGGVSPSAARPKGIPVWNAATNKMDYR
jgi:hypothetical protein